MTGRGTSPEVVELPDDNALMWPGGYLACRSAIWSRSGMSDPYLVRCLLPRGHDGDHEEFTDRGRRKWRSA